LFNEKKRIDMYPLASTIFHSFITAHPGAVCTVTLLLIALFFVAWKAPAWVKETGLVALAAGWLWSLLEFMAIGKAVEINADADPYIVWCAVPIAIFPAVYGTIVYIISLIIRIVRKPRL
jgi:hypothetical protein